MRSYETYSDQQLIDLLACNDSDAFTEIYYRYVEALYRYAWNILQEEDECKDAVEEVFVWIWENRGRLRITALKYYLLAAVKYKLLRAIQHSKRRAEIVASLPEITHSYIDETVELKELKAVIEQFTATLPARAREIFHLSRYEYLTNREIAAKMNISEKTVENQITITLKKLRHILGQMSFWSIFL
jgi:RNA polymerase sigma-70 factor (ECF subfamily)